MAKKFDDLDLVDVISCSCYVSGCENQASNKHLRGDYIVYFCEGHNPNYPELELSEKTCDNCGETDATFTQGNNQLCESCFNSMNKKRYNGEKLKDIPNGDVKAFYEVA